MRKTFKKILDSWITSLAGVAAYVLTTILIWQRVFDFVWEGIGGYVIGTILLMAPQSIESLVAKAIDNKINSNKETESDGTNPDQSN